MTASIDPPTDVPTDAEVLRCPYCERPFADAERRALHVGEGHAEAMDEDEQTAYEAAVDDEQDAMWLYHLKVVVVLLVLYMAIGLLYLLVLG